MSLLHAIREQQRRLVEIADKTGVDEAESGSVEEFLVALKTAWREGTPRPTDQKPRTEGALVAITQGSVRDHLARGSELGRGRS